MDPILEAGLRELAARSTSPAGPAGGGRLAGPDMKTIGEKLNRYIEELELFNPAYGLVAVADRNELVVKHILDSLAPLDIIDGWLSRRQESLGTPGKGLRIADAGSGAGLPGIPLAIAMGGRSFTLIERMGRRVGFLENAAAVLGLGNVEVEQSEVEKAPPGRFDLVVFRAFRPLEPPMLKALFRLLAPEGILGAYKARADRIEEEMAPIAGMTGGWEVSETPVPFLDEPRRFVLIRKPAA